ncbi:MAG TPA: DUF885 domain-containing protein [Chitinophagaceae bacterium]|nr:DUF885 domain-containing protein [Chitinophagaceae bacterium]
MKLLILSISLLLLFIGVMPEHHINFTDFRNNFVTGYRSLNIPDLHLSYAENFQHIQSEFNIQKQIDFFQQVKKNVATYKKELLIASEQDDLDLIEYETSLNLQRLTLEKKWVSKKPAVISMNNFHSIPDDSAWYVYFLKRWMGADVNPDELYLNGMEEIKRVKQHIEDIRLQTGMDSAQFYQHLNDSSFFITGESQVQQSFEHTKNIILKNLPNVFNTYSVPDVSIKRGANTEFAQTPGYYSNNTFYFNYFDKPYNKRQTGWLFIHEAIPGHHYQASVAAQMNRSAVQQLFNYPGFSEGWAAYTEELGKELGAYQTLYDELGKWEWDLVRSVRVPLDVGLNYYGWTDEKALAFWKQYIPDKDDIAIYEINRMRRWPAQVITYKYGAAQIMKWKELMQAKQGDYFDIKAFHDKVLEHGSLPLFLVEKNVFRK